MEESAGEEEEVSATVENDDNMVEPETSGEFLEPQSSTQEDTGGPMDQVLVAEKEMLISKKEKLETQRVLMVEKHQAEMEMISAISKAALAFGEACKAFVAASNKQN